MDTGRNPDLHTRSLLGRLANDNQQMLGQNMAMGVSITQLDPNYVSNSRAYLLAMMPGLP